ncbi:hypothetical protein AAF712_007039 [Marasmius tenuissimus]|uniref:Transformer n=1 Tax=Marasmius tenuissimus TaxID=585030 RepID=A0ABR2ZYN4_9AGAR
MQRFLATLSSPFSNGSSRRSNKSKSRRKERGRREEPIIVDNPNAMVVQYGSLRTRAPTAPPRSGAYRHKDSDVRYYISKSVEPTRHHRDTRAKSHHDSRREGSSRHGRSRRSRSIRSYDSRSRSRSRSSSREREYYDDYRRRDQYDHHHHRNLASGGTGYYHSRPPSPSPRHREGLSTDLRWAASVPRQMLDRGRESAMPPKGFERPPTIRSEPSLWTDDASSDISESNRKKSPFPAAGWGPGMPYPQFAPPMHPGYPPNYPPQYRSSSHAPHLAYPGGYGPHSGPPPQMSPYGRHTYPNNSYTLAPGLPGEQWPVQNAAAVSFGMGYPEPTIVPTSIIYGSTVSGPPGIPYNTLYAGWSPPPSVIRRGL